MLKSPLQKPRLPRKLPKPLPLNKLLRGPRR